MDYSIENSVQLLQVLKKIKPYDSILLPEGKFQEKFIITQNNITIIGKGQDKTFLENSDHYHKIMKDNAECNTFRTYTLKILGNNVNLKNLTVSNNATPSNKYGQAVALHVSGTSFKATNCTFKGGQDTIFLAPYPENLRIRYSGFISSLELEKANLTQVFNNCTIIGDVDFIFGQGEAIFSDCKIISIGNGYISAPAHSISQEKGFLFYKCDFIPQNIETQKVFLARPWRDYGLAFFYDCNYGPHILAEGFNKWNDTDRDKTCRFYEYSSKVLSNRAYFTKILNKSEADELLAKYLN